MAARSRQIVIDCFGVETPEASLRVERIFCAAGESDANEVDGLVTFT
jgi:hypothetical protein